MKTLNTIQIQTVIALLAILGGGFPAVAQDTAFTYQGRLSEQGSPVSGLYDFRAQLYNRAVAGQSGDALVSGTLTPSAVPVTNGLFVLNLDFGAVPFNGEGRWLALMVRSNGAPSYSLLFPRQPITSAPYAIASSNLLGALPASQLSGTVPSGNLGGTYTGSVTFNNSGNSFSGNGAALTSLNASQLSSGIVPDARLSANLARTNQVWLVGGNAATTAGVNFLGTTDSQPLELKVNNSRVLRLEDTGDSSTDSGTTPDGAPNILAGSPVNSVTAGVVGATISGGGATDFNGFSSPQSIQSDYATVGGGAGNSVSNYSHFTVISGGFSNQVGRSTAYATVSGGDRNSIDYNADYSTIGGGQQNSVLREVTAGFIGGGSGNRIEEYTDYATIAGGYQNTIENTAGRSVIGGGHKNIVASNSWAVTIAGGYANQCGQDTDESTIGGGLGNEIGENSWYATIAGGFDNTIPDHANYGMIPGGYGNTATNLAFAAGRYAHAIHTGAFVWADSARTGVSTYSFARDSVTFRAAGGYRLYTSSGDAGATLAAGGGSWTSLSDRNAKEDFRPVDPGDILEKVAALPLSTWKYKTQDASVRHMGPMAQDFQAAFGVGESDTGITAVDADGVALAAIQGLNLKMEDKGHQTEVSIQKLREENAQLRQRLEKLEQLLGEKLYGGTR